MAGTTPRQGDISSVIYRDPYSNPTPAKNSGIISTYYRYPEGPSYVSRSNTGRGRQVTGRRRGTWDDPLGRQVDPETGYTKDRTRSLDDDGTENMYNMLMAMFSLQPVYEIPQEVFDIMNLSTQTAETLANLYSQQREDVLGRLDVEGLRALDILGESKYNQLRESRMMEGKMMRAYRTGTGEALDTLGRSRAEQLADARRTEGQMVGAYKEGGQNALDILSSRAYGGLPGESQYLENLQAGTASAVENLINRGGGRGALGAMADIYSGQQGQMRGLAAQRAQFQSDAMLGLAGAQQQYGAGLADIYGRAGQTRQGIMGTMDRDIAGLQERRGQGIASIYETGGQTRIGIRSNMDQVLANTRIGLADQYAQNYQSTTGTLGSAISYGDQLINQALGNIADFRDKAWGFNYYQPFMDKRNFVIDQFNRNDPSDWYTNFINQMVGQTFNQQYQGIAGQMAGADMVGDAINQGLGNYFSKQYMDMWGGGNVAPQTSNSWRNPGVYNPTPLKTNFTNPWTQKAEIGKLPYDKSLVWDFGG